MIAFQVPGRHARVDRRVGQDLDVVLGHRHEDEHARVPRRRVQVLHEELLDGALVRVQPLDARRHQRRAHRQRQDQRGEDQEDGELGEIDRLHVEPREEDQHPRHEQAQKRADERRHIEIGVAAGGDDDHDLARRLALGVRDRIGDAGLLIGRE